jgi:hypothetical protein
MKPIMRVEVIVFSSLAKGRHARELDNPLKKKKKRTETISDQSHTKRRPWGREGKEGTNPVWDDVVGLSEGTVTSCESAEGCVEEVDGREESVRRGA